jgi:hypothetical protein
MKVSLLPMPIHGLFTPLVRVHVLSHVFTTSGSPSQGAPPVATAPVVGWKDAAPLVGDCGGWQGGS